MTRAAAACIIELSINKAARPKKEKEKMYIINNHTHSKPEHLKRLFDEVANGYEKVATVERTSNGLLKIITEAYVEEGKRIKASKKTK